MRKNRNGEKVRAKEEKETDIEDETQRRNGEGNGDGEKIGEGKLQGEREAENRAKEGKREGFLGKSQNSFDDAWASLRKGPSGDAVSKWAEAREEMATLPAFLLCPGLLASRSLLLAPLTPPKLAKPAVCQACPDSNTYCLPIAEEAGERVLEKGFESYKGPARLTRDNLREGSRKEKRRTSARMKELRQTGRQRD